MKKINKIIKNITGLLLFFILFTSCFKDKSLLDDNSIARYVIAAEKNKSFNVSTNKGEKLRIAPEILKIINGDTIRNVDDELTYSWKIATDPINLDTAGVVISSEKILDMIVPVPVNVEKYFLSLTISDKTFGVKTMATWNFRQSSLYYNGLFIAETEDNGKTSDVSLIISNDVSPQLEKYTPPKIYRNIFSVNNNGKKLRGEVSYMREGRAEYAFQLTFISEKNKSMTRVDGLDFSALDNDQEKFLIPQDNFTPSYLGYGYYELFLVNNGLLNCQVWQGNPAMLYSYPLEGDENGYYCSKWYSHAANSWTGSDEPRGVIYDELNGRFLKIPGKFSGFSSLQRFSSNNGGAFELNDVKNKTCEMAGVMNDERHIFMLRDKTTKNLSMYILAADLETDNGKTGLNIIDMTSFPDINNVVSYVMSTEEATIYYATKDKIYALLMTSGVFKVEERYTVPEGSIITTMGLMTNSLRYVYKTEINSDGKEQDFFIRLEGRTLIIALYNEETNEGTIRNQYIESLGAGVFSKEHIWEHKGFKKITAVLTSIYEN